MATIPIPRTQGLESSTFTQPPLDGSLSLPALYDWQAVHSAHHPLFIFDEAPGSHRTILWNEAHQAIQRAARSIREKVGHAVNGQLRENPPVIAVLASADTISYMTFIAGALRTGYILFPLSLRNSALATAALLQQTDAAHLFVSSDKHVLELVEAARKSFPPGFTIQMHAMLLFEELYPTKGFDSAFISEPLADINMSETAIILHSSGTTAFPKPIYITHRSLVETASFICFENVDLAGAVFACHSLPMFHGAGMFLVNFPVSCGIVGRVFKPQFPPVVPNAINTFEGAVVSDYVNVAPTFIETWSQDRHKIEALARIKGITYGGGPLAKVAGDTLASNGVNIHQRFASSQTFIVNRFFQSMLTLDSLARDANAHPAHLTEPPGMDWEYFEISPAREVHFIAYGNDEFELILLQTEWYCPSVINIQINGQNGYATGDLLSPHPTKRGFWKVVGRTDDQIMHSTGEKTNPGPLEEILMHDPFVSGAVIFGRGRFHCGVIVEPKEPYKFDPKDTEKLAEFRSLIWPTIENMNSFAPQHSRLFKEMILVASPSKPFTYTVKGTLRRQAIINDYTAEIEAMYAAIDESSQDDIPAPSDWSLACTHDFIRTVVEKTVKMDEHVIADNADLFEGGLDSLQATWICNSILHALKKSHPSVARQMPLTFVYDNPTITRLAEFISASVTSGTCGPIHDVDSKRKELHALVDKHSKHFPSLTVRGHQGGTGRVILLTGGTGSLGSNILAKLLENPDVTSVYAMSRPSSSGLSAKERHVKALEREDLNIHFLQGDRIRFLDGDPEKPDFGVQSSLYEEMQSSVTHVIHSAWRVNFNVAVASLESNVRGVRNFVDFALGSGLPNPARILFVSSIGVFRNYSENKLAPEEHLAQPDGAIGSGYAQSKWVSEQILRRASENSPLSAIIVRCGQMTGGPSGAWNDHEWFPSLIKSSITLGKLPDADGDISWISAYDAAGAIVDVLDEKSDVLHLVHPNPPSWSSMIRAFSKRLQLPTVSFAEWLDALEEAYADMQSHSSDAAAVEKILHENPALRLIDFFRVSKKNSDSPFVEPLGITKLENKKAVEASYALRQAELINEEAVRLWVSHWKKTGFLL